MNFYSRNIFCGKGETGLRNELRNELFVLLCCYFWLLPVLMTILSIQPSSEHSLFYCFLVKDLETRKSIKLLEVDVKIELFVCFVLWFYEQLLI